MTEFNGKIQIDKVVSSLNAFKKAIYNVNYINKLIIQNKSNIISAGQYASVIDPYIKNKYSIVDIDIDFGISNISLNENNLSGDDKIYYSYSQANWNNKLLNQSNSGVFIYNSINAYLMIKESHSQTTDYLNKILKNSPNSRIIYQCYVKNWTNGVEIVVKCIQKDVLDENKWIVILSSVNLSNYFSNADNLSTFSSEYSNFGNTISKLILDLESNQWNNTTLVKNIWEYSNISNITNTKCLYSEKYPIWNGKLISECFIPNSNIDVQTNMKELFKDLYFYYPLLTVGELAFSTRNINGQDILSICKIDTYNRIQCIKEVNVDLNKFFEKNNIIGDTILDGNIQINDGNGKPVVQIDNVTKNISINGKIGINQDLHEIKGLLDIDNLSVSNIYKIVDKIANISNISYNVVDQVKDSILNNGTFDISPDYINDVVILKIPILNKIKANDISFLYKPSNIFKTNKFSNDSFLKIQLIINEINRMSVEIENYNTQEGHKLIMSFVELLNDTEYYYICSLKAIFKDTNIYFVISFTIVQNIMINNSYKDIFTNIINDISSANRALNYSILIVEMQGIYDTLITTKDSVNSFTKYFQESEFGDRFDAKGNYQFCFTYTTTEIVEKENLGKFLFHEVNTYFNGNGLNEVYIPGTDKTDGSTGITVMKDYLNKYGQNKYGQNFCTNCTYTGGNFICVINKIIIKNVEYVIGNGVLLSNFMDKSILSKCDNKFTGNLLIQDIYFKNIFEVNTEEQKITHMYKTGFGTEYPKTIIDINDSGLTDIINIIKDMANKEHAINLNIEFIKNLDVINADNIDNCINTQFTDPNSGNPVYQQTKDDYFVCYTYTNSDKTLNNYTWLYRNWDNQELINIDDKNNKVLINAYISNTLKALKTQYNYDNFRITFTSDWTFGKKNRIKRVFKNNNKLYIFGNGINIGNYNLKINNNGNFSSFFDYIDYMNLYLQNFIIRLNNIDVTTIPNYKSVNDYFSIISNVVSPKQFTLKKIVADFSNFSNTKLYDIDFNTLIVSGNDLNKKINQLQDINERNKYIIMLTNIRSIYSKKNTNQQLFNIGDYGLINTEDDFVDFFSLFYCSEVNATSVTLISIEIKINTIIQPSVDLKGDLRIKGDTYFHNDNTNIDFVSIDTSEYFVGIGTNQRFVNYSNNYITTTNEDLSRHKFIISGNSFPISVHERTSEVAPERDSDGTISSYPLNRISDFSNKTSVTSRRKSNYFTINEMKEYASFYKETAVDGPNIGKIISYKYGPDMNFEIKDSTNITRELGNIHMVIDDIDNNNIKAGFGVNVVDTSINNKVVERGILYVNNQSVMDIDKINLGTDVDGVNTVLLSAKDNKLIINNVSLQTIIKDEIQKMFSVDSDGKLNIIYNGNTYVCEPTNYTY